MQTQPHTFQPRDLVAGHVVLDLVNTVTARNADPIDWLAGYSQLLAWARLTGEFDDRTLLALERASSADPAGAARALGRIKQLREALHDVLLPIVTGHRTPALALDRLERLWKDAVSHARLAMPDEQAHLQLTLPSSGLDHLNHALALRSVELLQTLPLGRSRLCPGPRCGWLFIDRSKGGRRRWCDMATCGNAAKSSRHRERLRRAPAGSR